MESKVSIVIPAYNEEGRIGEVVDSLSEEYEVLVVDDGSEDGTMEEAEAAGAKVIENEGDGYIDALKTGFGGARGEAIVTMDADGEHRPEDVERLVKPVVGGEYDLVFGAREIIPRPSERFLNRLAGLKVDVSDTGTGFRALKKELAEELDLGTTCTCGTFALGAKSKGARIGEVPVKTKKIDKPRRIAWEHFWQFFHVVSHLVKA
ncbi:MAG: glycosyltransferase family 2 protein [Candidatus Aenigmatarchaeota archaeon]